MIEKLDIRKNGIEISPGVIEYRGYPLDIATKLNELIDEVNKNGCPPHNLIPYHYEGSWSASVPPPNMRCTKCLMETRF